jgi:hypothetical protein
MDLWPWICHHGFLESLANAPPLPIVRRSQSMGVHPRLGRGDAASGSLYSGGRLQARREMARLHIGNSHCLTARNFCESSEPGTWKRRIDDCRVMSDDFWSERRTARNACLAPNHHPSRCVTEVAKVHPKSSQGAESLAKCTAPSNGSPLPIHRWAPTAKMRRRRKRLVFQR